MIIIDRQNRMVYAEYLADQMREPDYGAAIQAIRQAIAS